MSKKISDPELLALFAITALGVALRFYGLGERSLWYDEAEQMATAKAPWADFFGMIRGRFQSPPLDYLLMRPWVVWGQSDWLARFWSALASSLCIPALFIWSRSVSDTKTSLIAALLLASSSFAVDYSQEARMYSSFLLFTILSFLTLNHLQRSPSRGRALIYGLSIGSLLLTHYFSYWVLLLQAPWLLLELKKESGWVKAFELAMISWVFAAFLFLPWLPSFLEHIGRTHGAIYYGMPFTLHSFSDLLVRYSSGRNTPWFFAAAFFIAMIQAYRHKKNGIQAVAWIALGSLILPLAESQFKPSVAPRYLIFFLAPYYLVVAAGLAAVADKIKHGLWLLLCLLALVQVPAVLRDHHMGINAWKPRWHEAANLINADKGLAPVAVTDWTASIVMGYYLLPFENHFVPQLRSPAPPAKYRLVVADEALLRKIETGAWQGWVVLHFGVNRDPSGDAFVSRIVKITGAPRAHLLSPDESNGVDLYYCKGRS